MINNCHKIQSMTLLFIFLWCSCVLWHFRPMFCLSSGSGLFAVLPTSFLSGMSNTGMLFSLQRVVIMELWDLTRALTTEKSQECNRLLQACDTTTAFLYSDILLKYILFHMHRLTITIYKGNAHRICRVFMNNGSFLQFSL